MARILVAEDSETDLAYVRDVLASLPHEVVTVKDGNDVEKIAAAESFDLFILDVVMPGTNGFQVCRKLKKNPLTAQRPVILATSKASESDRFWGEKQGADVYLTKPFTPEQMLEAVQRCLDK